MKKLIHALLLLPFLMYFTSCNDDDSDTTPDEETSSLPTSISFESQSLFPEDFAYDAANERFFTGSAFTGNIVTVDLEGNVTTFADSDDLIATVGLLFDETNNQVVVCNTAPPFTDQGPTSSDVGVLATVIKYDASTGEVVNSFDLSNLLEGGHLINDIVIDNEGNLYVTDSFSPAIYKISSDGMTSVFATDSLFASPEGTFGLNGIEYHPDGYLLVTHYNDQILYRVDISDPTDITEVEIDTEVGSGDGIRLMDDNTLLFVNNSLSGEEHTVFSINSTDGWTTGSVNASTSLGSEADFPTTVEFANSTPYIIRSYIATLFGGNTDISTFEIEQVNF